MGIEKPTEGSGVASSGESSVTVRCPFCLTLNRVELGRASDRPKCGDCDRPILLDRPIKVQEEDFDRTVLNSQVPVLVDFYADWCAPCKMMAPMLDEVANRKMGEVLVVKVDTDRAPELAKRFQIRGIPTLMAFRDGEEVGRRVGFDPAEVSALVDEVL